MSSMDQSPKWQYFSEIIAEEDVTDTLTVFGLRIRSAERWHCNLPKKRISLLETGFAQLIKSLRVERSCEICGENFHESPAPPFDRRKHGRRRVTGPR